ncbi:hypothetical protein KVR01_003172 [Diaporthe batatas]|uniref:uncharacterized protein n=1 Tax=Diaporthe batatas TaxID=748121 RepID=UPI001D05632E|nr:uncharacterized protein KVR01_003172 [Diaporthe batatas]KAG8167483.1 hypothetical protein KVR01_003172 [Diaporthe batatas]
MSDIYNDNMVRNESEAQRLDEQFDLLTMNIGYLIHPEVAASLPPNPRVADIGTGTGHYLECFWDLASYPGATLDGYDISSTMFKTTARGSPSLNVLDIKQPVPVELHATYDLVHVRILVAAMLPGDWPGVVSNVARLVKPGGWVQWEECDMAGTKYLRGGEASKVDAVRQIGRMFLDALHENLSHGWNTLSDDMRAAGLMPIPIDCVSTDRLPNTRAKMTANGMRAVISWIRKTGAIRNEELEQIERQVYENIRSGCYCRFEVYVHCGQKL